MLRGRHYLFWYQYDMDSSKLVGKLNDIYKLLHKNTVQETIYLFKLYDMNHMETLKTLDDFSNRIDKIEEKIKS